MTSYICCAHSTKIKSAHYKESSFHSEFYSCIAGASILGEKKCVISFLMQIYHSQLKDKMSLSTWRGFCSTHNYKKRKGLHNILIVNSTNKYVLATTGVLVEACVMNSLTFLLTWVMALWTGHRSMKIHFALLSSCCLLQNLYMAFRLLPVVQQLYWGYWEKATTCSMPSLEHSVAHKWTQKLVWQITVVQYSGIEQ